MQIDGLQRLLNFLNHLRQKKIMFQLSQQRDDAIMVSFALVGLRVEAEFFENEVEFSTFKGDESVSADLDGLRRLIEANRD